MKLVLFTVLVFLIFICCKTQRTNEIFPYGLNQTTVLRFHKLNLKDSIKYRFCYRAYPQNDQSKCILNFNREQISVLRLMLHNPIYGELEQITGVDDYVNLFFIPGDTLDIFLNPITTRSLSSTISFRGTNSAISEYMVRYKMSFMPELNSFVRNTDFNSKIDSKVNSALASLYQFNFKKTLPKWFVRFEEENIKYTAAYAKFGQNSILYFVNKRFFHKPENYIEKLKFKIDSKTACYSEYYMDFLNSLGPEKYDTLFHLDNFSGYKISLECIADNLKTLTPYLSEETMSVYASHNILTHCGLEDIQTESEFTNYKKALDSLIFANKGLIKDSMLYKRVIDVKNGLYKNIEHRLR